jgi:hypothetical protein
MYRPISLVFLSILAVFAITTLAETPSKDLICHTTDPSECYPKVFEATEDFRIVRDDQDLPPGLHVRLNIQTGLKEAKLYDGEDDDLSNTIELFPEEGARDKGDGSAGSDVFPVGDLVDETPRGLDAPPAGYSPPAENDQVPIPPELLQHVLHGGDRTIKRPLGGDADAEAFTAALSTLSSADSSQEAVLYALSTLEDLAHDIYWGLTLAKSAEGIRVLVSQLRDPNVDIASTSALVLGNTVHNNPKALNLTLTHAPTLPAQIQGLLKEKVDGDQLSALPARQYTRLLFLLSSLLSGTDATTHLPSDNVDGLYGLLEHGYLDMLLHQFNALDAGSSDGWDRPRQAVADLVLDRIAGPDAAKQFTELMWRVWDGRDGYTGGGLGAAWAKDNVARSEAMVEEKGGADAGWRKVFGGKGAILPFWVRAPPEDEKQRLRKSPEPKRYSEAFLDRLVKACGTFDAALSSFEEARKSADAGSAEEHVREAHQELTARLQEVGCRCSGCEAEEQILKKEKTEL